VVLLTLQRARQLDELARWLGLDTVLIEATIS
jgi:hypothetical protein